MNANRKDVTVHTGTTKLRQCVNEALDDYFKTLEGETPTNLSRLVLCEVEEALIRYVMNQCRDNQCRAAEYLGINRGTLRKRLEEYGI
ncbi:MAG: Fis family transcriptional regulator [Gammaproteobacteria bacterium]|nr:Fis family transcriptional regulator [Gammaproteobacteria bacterium]